MKKRLYILHIFNKTTLTKQNRPTVLHNLFLLDIFIKTGADIEYVEKRGWGH